MNVDVLHCKTPLIFGSCVELHPLLGVFHMLYFKIPLMFGACVELRPLFGVFHILHFKIPLIFLACVELRLSTQSTPINSQQWH